jgi:hypothetical protein
MTADEVVAALGLAPHPEGGFYRETWRHEAPGRARGAGSAIYYLLAAGQVSHWHRVDAAEIWHFYAGAPLVLRVAVDGRAPSSHRVGPDLARGDRPQLVVPAGAWQSARCDARGGAAREGWSLVGCTVSPAFDFAGFELAPPGFEPERG